MAATVDVSRIDEHTDEPAVLQGKIAQLAEMVKASHYTVFFTGAGISTSSGVGDFRGPSGAWTNDRISHLEKAESRSEEDERELEILKRSRENELKKAEKQVDITDAEPNVTHMSMVTLLHRGLAHYMVTTNCDGILRKAGFVGHVNLTCLHGDIYVERCTACGYDFERNWHTRQPDTHIHDHGLGNCTRCGSQLPAKYTGYLTAPNVKTGSRTSFTVNGLISTTDSNMGTKDTHINFGENLDKMDWNEAAEQCGRADLIIVAGSSMSLRHVTHFPFMAKKTVIINLQPTPDDRKAHLRIWATCDEVFVGLMGALGVPIEQPPIWHPKDALPISEIPKEVNSYYIEAAMRLSQRAILAGGILLGNTYSHNPGTTPPHEYTLYVKPAPVCSTADLEALIRCVEFRIPQVGGSGFSVQKVLHAPFQVVHRVEELPSEPHLAAVVVIMFRVKLHKPNKTLNHTLCFSSPDTSSTINIS
ncbi:transcriptional regulator, Sir2 family protein [Pelomyxa schiedti]|nr:transcriptional regulator, Sir2 family protein [Pelomyxa schiedti]